MAHLNRHIVELRAGQNCFTHALVIAITKVDNYPNYEAFRKGRKLYHGDQTLLETTGIELSNGAGINKSSVSRITFGSMR